MADIAVYRITAVGPTSAYATVDSESVKTDFGQRKGQISGQNINVQHIATLLTEATIEWTEKQVVWGAFTEVASLGVHYRAFDDGGGDGTGNISVVSGAVVVPQSVKASKGGAAETMLRAILLGAPTVGTTANNPVTASDLFTVGPSTLGGTDIDGIESQELDFGYTVWTDAGQSGTLTPTNVIIQAWNPVITITTTDLALVDGYLSGVDINSNACVLKFEKISNTATGYQYTAGKAHVQGRISGGNPAIGTLTIACKGSETPIVGAAY